MQAFICQTPVYSADLYMYTQQNYLELIDKAIVAKDHEFVTWLVVTDADSVGNFVD